MQIAVGGSRVVLLFENVVVKIPKFWDLAKFGIGIVENLRERYWWCADYTQRDMNINERPLAPIRYASSNGLIVVMQRAKTISDATFAKLDEVAQARVLSDIRKLKERFSGQEFECDIELRNIGYIDLIPVVIDYGFAVTPTYLGNERRLVVKTNCYGLEHTVLTKWFRFKSKLKRTKLWTLLELAGLSIKQFLIKTGVLCD